MKTLSSVRWHLILVPLMFFGMSTVVLGLRYDVLAVAIFGGIYILVTAFTAFSYIPPKALIWTLIGASMGALAGAVLGALCATVAELLAGVVAGAVLGMMVGMILLAIMLRGVAILPGVEVMVLPETIASLLFIGAETMGAIGGIVIFREPIIKVFGPMGGGAVAIGILGMITGSLLGTRRIESL